MAASIILRFSVALPKQFSISRSAISSLKVIQGRRNFHNEKSDPNLPLKYTNSSAAKLSVTETLNVRLADQRESQSDILKYKRIALLLSFTCFMVYFCILREENDIDEILKGNQKYQNDYAVLANLQIKLAYCKQNNIPCEAIQKKISAIKEHIGIKD